MKSISVADSVVISLALRSEIRRYVKCYKLAVELHMNASVYLEEIRDLIHAYNSVNTEPFDVGADIFLLSILK